LHRIQQNPIFVHLDLVHFAFMWVPTLTFEDVWDTKPERLLHWPLGRFEGICKQTEGERWEKTQWPACSFLFASSSLSESK